MPASSSEAKGRWKKRKRDNLGGRRSKLKEPENDDALEENEDDEDLDLDPPRNSETGDDHTIPNAVRTNQLSRDRESEKLVDGGLRICDFPVAIKRTVNRPHLSVMAIAGAEWAARNGDSSARGQGGVMLENISYGQLQALSAVPRNSPALSGALDEETASGSGNGSYVIKPPRITAGRGVTKRLGTAARVHVVPAHSEWFSPSSVDRLERQVVPHFFSGKSAEHTPEKYMEIRNFIVAKYMQNPEKHLSVAECQGLVTGFDVDDLTRIMRFLDHWGIINYCATPLKHEGQKDGTYLYEDSNGELHVPTAALKSIDSLIQFDKPKCRLKATDIYPQLACQLDEDTDLDSTIREQLSEHHCTFCSRSITEVHYQSQKEADVQLCLDCFQEGRFVVGHSSLDFMKVSSTKDYADVDENSWSDQETLLLLEGMQLYNENWNKIAEHVGSKSKAQCILQFVRLPLDSATLGNIDVPSTSGSSTLWIHDNHEKQKSSNGVSSQEIDSGSKFPFSDVTNPVMNLVSFLASALGPRIAAACAHESLASLCKDGDKEKSPHGDITNSSKKGLWGHHDAAPVPLSAERVRAAAEDGLAAAAMKAKLFADHEEREIQRLSANIINHQLKRLELKLKQFAEIETLLMRECELMERARQKHAADRAQMISQLGGAGFPRPMGLPGVGTSNVNNFPGNNRQQVFPSQQPFISGYGNNQSTTFHPQMAHMQQQGMYGHGPRMPSAINPASPAAPNSMFNRASTSQSSLGHPMLRPLSGTKSGLG